jgi:hypothetical protein
MKEVINLVGDKELVSVDTPVKTVDGIHYLHTPEDIIEIDTYEADYLADKANYEANHRYKDDRKKAYGAIEDQLDMIYWDQVNGTTTFKDHVTTVKTTYPKPGV